MSALPSGVVHVWYRRTEAVDDQTRSSAIALLSGDERARHDRLRAQSDRDEYALAHALLRSTLSTLEDRPPESWRFASGPFGKPELADAAAALSFNLSHTRGLVACAVAARADVGIDIEPITRPTNWRGIASRYFSRAELAEIDRLDPASQATRFFEIWTLKEAFVKALGVGLSQPLSAMTFSVDQADAVAFIPPPGITAAAWQFGLYAPTRGHRLAVAISDGKARRWRMTVHEATTRATSG